MIKTSCRKVMEREQEEEEKELLFDGCLKSPQHASVSQARICSDRFTCYHTELEVADQTFYLTQSQYSETSGSGTVFRNIGIWDCVQTHRDLGLCSDTSGSGTVFRNIGIWDCIQKHRDLGLYSETSGFGTVLRNIGIWDCGQKHRDFGLYLI